MKKLLLCLLLVGCAPGLDKAHFEGLVVYNSANSRLDNYDELMKANNLDDSDEWVYIKMNVVSKLLLLKEEIISNDEKELNEEIKSMKDVNDFLSYDRMKAISTIKQAKQVLKLSEDKVKSFGQDYDDRWLELKTKAIAAITIAQDSIKNESTEKLKEKLLKLDDAMTALVQQVVFLAPVDGA